MDPGSRQESAPEQSLEPLGSAPTAMVPARPVVVAMIPVTTAIAVATAIHAALPPAFAAAEPASPMRQDGKAALLAVVEGLVQRISRIRDLLQRRRRRGH